MLSRRAASVALVLVLLAGLSAMGIYVSADQHAAQIHAQADRGHALSPSAASDVVYTTRTGSCYHRNGCKCLAKSKIKTTRGAAIKQGYRPCRICRP